MQITQMKLNAFPELVVKDLTLLRMNDVEKGQSKKLSDFGLI